MKGTEARLKCPESRVQGYLNLLILGGRMSLESSLRDLGIGMGSWGQI